MTRRGFTLVEVLIAVAISAIIGVLVMGAFQRAYSAKEITEANDERYAAARIALTRIARELSEAYLSEHYDHKRFRERPTLFKGEDEGDRDVLTFTSMCHERLYRDAKESDQALIEYKLDSDPDEPGTTALWRREKTVLDDDPERGGTSAIAADGVTGFDVSYWDWKKQEWASEWDSAGAERQGQLPVRVRVKLTLKMPDGKDKEFETQTRIAMIRPLDF